MPRRVQFGRWCGATGMSKEGRSRAGQESDTWVLGGVATTRVRALASFTIPNTPGTRMTYVQPPDSCAHTYLKSLPSATISHSPWPYRYASQTALSDRLPADRKHSQHRLSFPPFTSHYTSPLTHEGNSMLGICILTLMLDVCRTSPK